MPLPTPPRRRFCRMAGVALLPWALGACSPDAPPPADPVYAKAPARAASAVIRLAVHPLHNPARLVQAYQPLIDHLNRQMPGQRFELEASRDYADFERKIDERGPELLLPNPWQTLQAQKQGYRVLAMAGDAQDFHGLLLVPIRSAVQQVRDLKGLRVSYPAPTALAAAIMPQWLMHTAGLDVMKDVEHVYVGSQESSIMSVARGLTDAAATWPPPWRAFQHTHPELAAQLRVLATTPPLVNNSVMARHDVPTDTTERIVQVLTDLESTPEGHAILLAMQTARFHPANDQSYASVRVFVRDFEQRVRPIESTRP